MEPEKLDQIYGALSPSLEVLEKERAAVHAHARRIGSQLLVGSGAVLLLTLIIVVSSGKLAAGLIVGGIWALGAAFYYHFTAGRRKAEFRTKFKTQIIEEVVRHLEPGIRYTGEQGIPESVFDGSGLFSRRSDRYRCEDGFRGTIGQTSVVFSEVHAEYKQTSRDSKGHTRTSYHTIFDGLFMIADFHKEFRSPVLVLPDVAERTLGLLGKKLQSFRPFSDAKLVYLEDPEFERHFVVYGADQIEARYILSTSMLRRILDLKEKWQDDVHIHFRNSTALIAIKNKHNLFEPKIKQSALDRNQIERICQELWCCFQIVEDLNLNTRVWTKE